LYAVYTYVKYIGKYMILKVYIEENTLYVVSTVHNESTFDKDS